MNTEIQNIKQRFEIIGTYSGLDRAIEKAVRVSPTDITVLVTGESGVGKEAFPKIIHQLSHRKHNKFIAVNCGAIPEGTIDSELFGHEKGSFTGADEKKDGKFLVANGGTIFLDEVSALPIDMQGKLLKVLVENSVTKVGSDQKIDVDVRFISATSSDLSEKIKAKLFREDLFHRLNVVPIKIPNLNERIEDIPILAEHFVEKLSLSNGLVSRDFSDEALSFLQSMSWPGNIRQLKNLIERVLILGDPSNQISRDELVLSDVLTEDKSDKKSLISEELSSMPLREAREVFERDYLILQINRFSGNISKTASFVEMERSALHRKLKSLGINSGQKN